MKLTSKNVKSIFLYCLFEDSEDASDPVRVEGLISNFGFHKGRVEEATPDIADMLSQLPKEFQQWGDGGWSFLNSCINAEGEQWTGDHRIMDLLFSLGQACGKVECLLPREVWPILPGGVPYYVVL